MLHQTSKSSLQLLLNSMVPGDKENFKADNYLQLRGFINRYCVKEKIKNIFKIKPNKKFYIKTADEFTITCRAPVKKIKYKTK